ncbi:MAG: hypothetical protein QXY22_00810 [Candidatus Nitrosotenuis sp.]
MVSQGRMIIYAAIAALLAMLGGITWYASLDNPKLEMAELSLGQVKIINVNSIENRANLEVGLKIRNPSDKPFTVSHIDYELFANGQSLGKGQYSAQDIPMPGRAIFSSNAEIELPSMFALVPTPATSELYTAIISGQPVQYTVKGIMVVESAWSLVEKPFDTSQ